jgi:hypothetical protein
MIFHLITMVQISAIMGTFTFDCGPIIFLQSLQSRNRARDRTLGRMSNESIAFLIDLDPDSS